MTLYDKKYKKCRYCSGKGYEVLNDMGRECDNCKGAGYTPVYIEIEDKATDLTEEDMG